MVMKRNAMRKNLTRTVWKSFGRYIAIAAIIALGTSLFMGLRMTKYDMVATGQAFTDVQNMFDLRLVSSYGWALSDVQAVEKLDGVVDAEGVFYLDAIVNIGERETESVYRLYSLPETVDRVALRGGRMPERADECLADGFQFDDSILGTKVTLSQENAEDTTDALNVSTFTIVGYVSSPLYMDMNRGTTSVGSGSISSYFYLPADAFDVDYYTEIHVTIPGEYDIFTQEYNDAMDAAADAIEPLLLPIAQKRFETVLAEAEKAYADGLKEYEQGRMDFEAGKQEAQQELSDAYEKLTQSEAQLAYAENEIASGWAQLNSAKQELEAGESELEAYEKLLKVAHTTLYAPLEASKAALEAELADKLAEIDSIRDQIATLEAQIAKIDSDYAEEFDALSRAQETIASVDTRLVTVDASLATLNATLNVAKRFPSDSGTFVAELEARIATLNEERATLIEQRTQAQEAYERAQSALEAPLAEREELEASKRELEAQLALAEQACEGIETSIDGVRENIAALDEEFAPTEEKLASGRAELEAGREQIAQSEQQLWASEATVESGKAELEKGWAEYDEAVTRVEEELADAQAKLDEADRELSDARDLIKSMDGAEVFVLDRNSNVGYASLDSNSDIVYSVSKVFPVFFLLIASLVCITTMTRMIDEERTQIGTLKALGYANGAIIGKYMLYAGSGAVLGCGVGVLIGSTVFPKILWEAYCIMLYIQPNVVLTFDWTLSVGVTVMYTVAILAVTWYSCHRTLAEVPAELIRPKAPVAGKKMLLEKLPVWERLSFLNKVTVRNIFRYHQRLAMMLVGIGGCTALLLTGFGLRDTIVNIADYQFEEVTTYDIQVYFTDAQSNFDEQSFRKKVSGAETILFYHQESVELEAGDQTREVYLMASDAELSELIDFHAGETPVSMPQTGEVLLSVGIAEAMGVKIGDTVTLRTSDMQVLRVCVSGIYDNHVYNYAIVTPETVQEQLGALPQKQMALIRVAEDADVHAISAYIAGLPRVMNVSVSEDLASLVGSMMDALDLVVLVIVICAGALAVIVLYNLTNININERIREVATIKVLGFNATETGAYVFKENLALTVMGTLLGLPLGRWFLGFVIEQIKIDLVWFKPRASVWAYVLSALMTVISALIVDWIFYYKLERINMAEALKSVE